MDSRSQPGDEHNGSFALGTRQFQDRKPGVGSAAHEGDAAEQDPSRRRPSKDGYGTQAPLAERIREREAE